MHFLHNKISPPLGYYKPFVFISIISVPCLRRCTKGKIAVFVPPHNLSSVIMTIKGECDDGPPSLKKRAVNGKREGMKGNRKACGMEMVLENVIKPMNMNKKEVKTGKNQGKILQRTGKEKTPQSSLISL